MRLAPDFGIVGYTPRWQYRPGETVALHLSSGETGKADIRLHRFRALRPHGEELELDADPVDHPALRCTVGPQRTLIGSWFEARLDAGLLADGFTLALLAMPTVLSPDGSCLASLALGECVVTALIDAEGRPMLMAEAPAKEPRRAEAPFRLRAGAWVAMVLSRNGPDGDLVLTVREEGRERHIRLSSPDAAGSGEAVLRLASGAAASALSAVRFDGRLEAPVLWAGAVDTQAALQRLDAFADGGEARDPGLVAAWDFSRAIDSARAEDVGPRSLHGRLVNLPTRAVKGTRWSGGEQSFRHAPRDYAAIHFHSDDLADAGWPVVAELVLPEDLASGVYLVEISGQAGRDTLPILVRPRAPGADLAFLASTFTWLAYANDRCLLHGANPEMFASRLLVLTAGDCALAAHPEYGLSLYDTHADGSGVSYASRRRPCLTLRHTQRAWQGGLGSGLWNFSADLLILSWLDREGFAFDIVTDDDLDREGAAALRPYRCVITGSHPEYHTTASHDALGGFLDGGGRLIYLGGNGFYWRVSTHPDHPETIELRRAEDGNRSWASEPGEYYHAFDGAYGGLWRRNGRPPQKLAGTGYTGQGFYRSHPYRLSAGADDPRLAFLFDGVAVADGLIGDFGLSGGGAAGIEIDRADTALGTPAHALVVATSERLDDSYVLANEEVLVNRPTVTGDMSPILRADMVFFETQAGGAVWSTGSVAWAGALAETRSDNEIAQITRNALTRFLAPAPFALPGAEPGG